MKPIPDATGTNLRGEGDRLIIDFMSATGTTSVKVHPEILKRLISQLAQGLSTSPVQAYKAVAQIFTVRKFSAGVHGNAPTMRYEIEAGLTSETTIDVADARELHRQLEEILSHVDATGSAAKH